MKALTYLSLLFLVLIGFSCKTTKHTSTKGLIAASKNLNTESYNYSVEMYSFGQPQKVYTLPSTNSQVLGTLQQNSKVIVSYLSDNNWCAFYFNGKRGFVLRTGLQYTPVASSYKQPTKQVEKVKLK